MTGGQFSAYFYFSCSFSKAIAFHHGYKNASFKSSCVYQLRFLECFLTVNKTYQMKYITNLELQNYSLVKLKKN